MTDLLSPLVNEGSNQSPHFTFTAQSTDNAELQSQYNLLELQYKLIQQENIQLRQMIESSQSNGYSSALRMSFQLLDKIKYENIQLNATIIQLQLQLQLETNIIDKKHTNHQAKLNDIDDNTGTPVIESLHTITPPTLHTVNNDIVTEEHKSNHHELKTIVDTAHVNDTLNQLHTSNRLPYQSDSPLYQQLLSTQRQRVSQFFARLDVLQDKLRHMTHAASIFSESCIAVCNELNCEWNTIEMYESEFIQLNQSQLQSLQQQSNDTHSTHHTTTSTAHTGSDSNIDECTLQQSMNKLSQILGTTSTCTSNLAQFIDHILVDSIELLTNKQRDHCRRTQSLYDNLSTEYELQLVKYLNGSRKSRERKTQLTNMFGLKRVLDDELVTLCQLKRDVELKRVDHIYSLNSVLNEKRIELIEIINSVFYAFVTYYHEGEFMTTQLQPAVNQQTSVLNIRKLYESAYNRSDKLFRHQLVHSALPINAYKLYQQKNQFKLLQPADNHTLHSSDVVHRYDNESYLRYYSKRKSMYKRRYFILKNYQFYYVSHKSSVIHTKLICNLLTCTARICSTVDLDYCFEVITPSYRCVYQADTELECQQWVDSFSGMINDLLSVQQSRTNHTTDDNHVQHTQLLSQIRHNNPVCADCTSTSPDWCSINLGILICIQCSGIHRSLGVHISKIRSITLDHWELSLLQLVGCIGNNIFNELYEYNLLNTQYQKPKSIDTNEIKEEYVRDKYIHKKFILNRTIMESNYVELYHSINTTDNIQLLVSLLPYNINLNWVNADDRHRTLMHQCATYNALHTLELLIQNTCDLTICDDTGGSIYDTAVQCGSQSIVHRLQQLHQKSQCDSI